MGFTSIIRGGKIRKSDIDEVFEMLAGDERSVKTSSLKKLIEDTTKDTLAYMVG